MKIVFNITNNLTFNIFEYQFLFFDLFWSFKYILWIKHFYIFFFPTESTISFPIFSNFKIGPIIIFPIQRNPIPILSQIKFYGNWWAIFSIKIFFFKLLTHVVDDWRHPEGNPDQEQRHGEKEASCGHDRPTRPRWKLFRIDELFLRTGIVNLAPFSLPLSAWPVILLPRCLDFFSTAQDLLFFQLIRYVQRHVIVVVVVDLSARCEIFCFLVIFVL